MVAATEIWPCPSEYLSPAHQNTSPVAVVSAIEKAVAWFTTAFERRGGRR